MAKNYFYNLLLTLTNLLFPILSFPYLSRVLGPEGIGKVQFIFSFTQYFVLLANIGIPIYGMKEIARQKDNITARSKVFSELIVIYFLTSLLLSVVYFGVIFTIPFFNADRNLYVVASLMIMLGFFYVEWLYIGMEEFKSIALRSVLFKIIGLALFFIFIKQRSDFKLYLYIILFSFLGNNILSFFLIKGKVRLIFVNLQLRKHIVPLLLILSTTIASGMYTIMDTVLLGFLSTDKMVGLYTAADKLSNITLPLVTSMSIILIPKIAKNFEDKDLTEVQLTLNQTFRFLMFFSIPIVFGLALLAPEFITLFSGKEFLPATNCMRILALLPIVVGLGHLFLFLILIPAGRNKEMLFCVLGGLIVFLILNVLLVPRFQAVGSSIANIVSELIVTSLYFYYIKKYFSFTYEWALLGKAVLSAMLFIPIIWLARQFNLQVIYMLAFSIISCVFTYVAVQYFILKNLFVLDIIAFIKLKIKRA